MFWVYAIVKIDSDCIYLGKTSDLTKRWREHKKRARAIKPRYHIHRAIKKYDLDNFRFVPIASFRTENESLIHEIDLIRFYREIGYHVYNKTDGGDGISGYRFNDSEKIKRRERMISRWNDPEFRKSMIEKRIGQKRSKEFCEQQRKRAIANWQNLEIRQRNIDGIKTSHKSDGSKEKRGAAIRKALADKKIKQKSYSHIHTD